VAELRRDARLRQQWTAPGAIAGAAVVTVRLAEQSSSATVRVDPESVQIRIDGFQLSQAIQRSENSVPSSREGGRWGNLSVSPGLRYTRCGARFSGGPARDPVDYLVAGVGLRFTF
jgi:hypothetical protein